MSLTTNTDLELLAYGQQGWNTTIQENAVKLDTILDLFSLLWDQSSQTDGSFLSWNGTAWAVGSVSVPGVLALSDATTITTDASENNIFTVTLGGDRTMDNPTNLVEGSIYTWEISQDTVGTRLLTWGSNFLFSGGVCELSTNPGEVDIIKGLYVGGKLHCTVTSGFAVVLPVNTVAPVISGTGEVGETLSATTGTWNYALSYTYQWHRNGADISGETGNEYTLVEADKGMNLTCEVIAVNATGDSLPEESNTILFDFEGNYNFEEDLNYTFEDEINFEFEDGVPFVDGYTAKSVILDIADNWGDGGYIGLRSVDFYKNGSLISVATADISAYVTRKYNNVVYYPDNVFDTSLSKTGTKSDTSWYGEHYYYTDQRLICVFDTIIEFDSIVINNFHSSGASTTTGCKNVKIHISDDSITSTVYNSAISNSTEIFDGQFDQHSTVDEEDPQTLDIGL